MNKTTEQFILEANNVHNNFYDYSKTNYINRNCKVIVICPTHGNFFQRPADHLRGSGCPKCRRLELSLSRRNDKEDFITKSKTKYGEGFDYSKVIYINNKTEVELICNKHGPFFVRPDIHLFSKSGCPKCKGEKTSNRCRKSKEQFIKDAIKIHGNQYDYGKVNYIRNHFKVEITCKNHGSFYQTPNCHTIQKQGCPFCNKSKGETKIKNFLDSKQTKYITQKTFGDCRNNKSNKLYQFDFYIPSLNLLIEFDGKQHYQKGGQFGSKVIDEETFKDIVNRDRVKSNYAKSKNINLVRIKYTDFDKIENILEKLL